MTKLELARGANLASDIAYIVSQWEEIVERGRIWRMKRGLAAGGLLLLALPALWWRVGEAAGKAMNPDEVLILLIARPASWLEECRVYHHPPLFYWVLHWVQKWSTGETALRVVSIVAGMVAPALLWAWMRRAGLEMGAWLVAGVGWWGVGLAKTGTEVRGYALALALLAGAAWLQERWLQVGGRGNLLGYGVLLWLAMLTEYGVFFGWVALGVYGWWERRKMGRGWWAVQGGVVVMLGVLYWWQVRGLERDPELELYVEGYLSRFLVQPGDNWVWFAVKRVPGLLKFLVEEYSVVGVLLVGLAVGWWQGGKTGALSVGVGVAMLLAWAAAIVQRYPLGATRQALLLGMMVVVAGAAGLDVALRGRKDWLRRAVVGLVLAVVVYRGAGRGYLGRGETLRELKAAMGEWGRGEWVWTELEAIYLMRYYLREEIRGEEALPVKAMRLETRGGAEMEAFRWSFGSEAGVRKDWQKRQERARTERVKLLDSGFGLIEAGGLSVKRGRAVQVMEIER